MGMLKIILASTGARPAEIKRLLFLHFYSTDFGAEERTQIASALARRGATRWSRKALHEQGAILRQTVGPSARIVFDM